MQLTRVPTGPARDAFVSLLDLADSSPTQVASYYQTGDLYALQEPTGETWGVTLVVSRGREAAELKAVAVVPELHGMGLGQRMIALVLAEMRAAGIRRVVVGTASSSIGPIAFYQKAGFRLWTIERDFFSEQRGYPAGLTEDGIAIRDMVWMDQSL
jgi:ribosomal protein S18 acetylase RimI-like enzyme